MSKKKRGYIFILPSLFTTGNLFCGFYSITSSFHQDFERAAYAILFAALFDILDGRIARITGSESRFGLEYDSISDVVSFGLAPALLIYIGFLEGLGRVGFAASFFFAACVALRLARFNLLTGGDQPKSYFHGLPSPAAANFVAAFSLLEFSRIFEIDSWVVLFATLALSFLMVSGIRYRSFKDVSLKNKEMFFLLVVFVVCLLFVIIRPELSFAFILSYYIFSGPVGELILYCRSTFFPKNSQAFPPQVLVREKKEKDVP